MEKPLLEALYRNIFRDGKSEEYNAMANNILVFFDIFELFEQCEECEDYKISMAYDVASFELFSSWLDAQRMQ